MEKAWLLLILIILFYFSTKFVGASNSCWRNPPCTCFGKNRTTINCKNVENINDVTELFKSRSPVYEIHIQGYFTTIPSRAFDNISTSMLWITSPLQEIPSDSLLGMENLKILILNKTLYETIPEAFSNQYYTEFASSHGRLTSIQTQLQNMSFATEIRLNKNQITSVSPEAFYGTEDVRRIDLSYNELIYMHPKTFEFLTFLEYIYLQHNQLLTLDGCLQNINPMVLNLYGNNLTTVDRVLHSGMWNLKNLNIGGNPSIEISSHSFNNSMKSLSELHLSNNSYTKLDPYLLKRLFNLHKLYLNNNNLAYVPHYFFENNHFLDTLSLSNNRLSSIEEAMRNLKGYNWMRIRLDGNNFKSIALGNETIKILSLDISRNQISHIKTKDMAVLQRVAYLNLSHNDLTSLDSEIFRNLVALKELDLSHNLFKHLNESLQNLSKLKKLQLSSISLEYLSEDDFLGTNKLTSLYLRNNSLQTVSGAFKHLKYLSILDVAMNNMTTLTVESFPTSWNSSMRIRLLWMAGNPWACDCRLAWMASWLEKRGSKLGDEPICASPVHLKNQTLRSLNLTDYLKWFDDCPETCECTCQYDDNQIYTEAHCVQQGLKEIPKIFPNNVRILDLSWNNIEAFNSTEILELKNLEQLKLEHNSIHKIQISLFPPRLSSLRLAYNKLRRFPLDEWIAVNASLSDLSLSHNPWICNCDAWNFRNWIVQENGTIIDADEMRCDKEESLFLRNKLIISLARKELCFLTLNIIILSICSALFLIFCLLIFCYRHSLIAVFYTWGCTCLKVAGRHDYSYDVFLMYCDNDEQLALGELATALENSKYFFNLCIPNRDIAAPRTQQKIDAYLPQCTKVLVLLTRSFIENRDCMRFLISAMSFSTDSTSERIIFVTKGELPNPYELDPLLKTLLRKCICLRWGECLFWQKLIYQLPKKGKKQHQWDDVEEEPLSRS